MIRPEIRRRIKQLSLQARHHLDGSHHGSYLSKFKGTGMDFAEYRPYIFGDDIKHIDWKVTARSTRPHIRVFKEERDLCIALLIDVSSSMHFGSHPPATKLSKAVEIAAYFITLAAMHQDRSCLFLLADDIMAHSPPGRHEMQAQRLLMKMLSEPPSRVQPQRTNLAKCLSKVRRLLTRRTICILISDFYDDSPYEPLLRVMAKHHDIHLLKLLDPVETNPPRSWFFDFCEPESGMPYLLDSPGRISQTTAGLHADQLMEISTNTPALDVLTQVVRQPRRRRGVGLTSLTT